MKREDAIAALRECIADGLTLSESARRVGLHVPTAHKYKTQEGLVFPYRGRGAPRKLTDPRADEMARLYKSGRTLEQIGEQYGITRERVRQLITKYHGRLAKRGGGRLQADARRSRIHAARDARFMDRYGCTFAQWKMLSAIGKRMATYRGPLRAFIQQRNSARTRGIGWELTLWQWWTIWDASGHWHQRGRGQGYCMCRRGDTGPYAEWNVFIAPSRENSSRGKNKKSGLPIGVRRDGRCKSSFIAHRCINGKKLRLGTYRTAEEAHAAYLAAAPTEQVAA